MKSLHFEQEICAPIPASRHFPSKCGKISAAWVFFSRNVMGAFREILRTREALLFFNGAKMHACVIRTLDLIRRFRFLISPRTDFSGEPVFNPWRACGAAL